VHRLLPICLLAAGLTACGGAPEAKKDPRSELLSYRSPAEVCTSDSAECKTWTELALKCEQNLANAVAGNACTKAEEYREQVTGVALSSDPGAYSF